MTPEEAWHFINNHFTFPLKLCGQSFCDIVNYENMSHDLGHKNMSHIEDIGR